AWAHSIWIVLILIEAVFILGFISLRWDKLLMISYLLFFVGGWLIFQIYNVENLIFLLTLTPALVMINRLKDNNARKLVTKDKTVSAG
ncbi:hypothetical protein ACX0G7_26055, partial [Flavitalea antarctica]